MNTEIIGIPITFIILSAAVLWLIILGKGYWWLKAFIVAVVLYFSLAMWFSLTNFSGWPVDIDMPNKFLVHWALVKQPSKKDVYQQGSILIWATEVDENNETIVQQNKTLITPFTRSEKAVEPRVYKIPYSEKMHQKLIDAMKQITQGKQIIGENKSKGNKKLNNAKDEGLEGKDKMKGSKGKNHGGIGQEQDYMFYDLPEVKLPEKIND
jgi:hypothetical protein